MKDDLYTQRTPAAENISILSKSSFEKNKESYASKMYIDIKKGNTHAMKDKICTHIKTYKLAIFGGLLLIFSTGIFFRLFLAMDLYSDDFYYGTFFKNGISSFFVHMREHFFQNNGRTIVHTLACIALAFGKVFLSCLMTFILVMIPVIYSKIVGKSHEKTLYISAFFLFFVMTVSPLILKESLFWISGFFNYVFPFLCLISALYLQNLTRKTKSTRTIVLFSLFQLVLGATNEQPSAATAFATAFLALCYMIEEHKVNIKYLLAPAMNTLGFASIFLSPGTLSRFNGETATANFVYRTGLQIAEVGKLFLFDGAFTLSVLFFLLISLYPLVTKKGSKLLLLGLPMGLAFVILRQFATRRLYVFLAFSLLLLYLFLAAMIFTVQDKEYTNAALLLSGMFSVFVISLTATIGPRVAVCLIFSMALVLSQIVHKMISDVSVRLRTETFFTESACVLAIASFCLFSVAPTLRGYLQNETVRNENLAAIETARQTGILHYNMDFDVTCTHTPIFRDGYCYNVFVDYYDLQGIPIYFESEFYPAVYVNGQKLPFVAIVEEDRIFLPIERIVAAFGGNTAWTPEKTDFLFFGRAFSLVGDLLYEGEAVYDAAGHVHRDYYCMLFSDDVLRDIFGLTIRYDSTDHAYHISRE